MNRHSLFGRFVAPATSRLSANLRDYRRVQLEALEERRMLILSQTVWVNDTWVKINTGTLAPETEVTSIATGDKVALLSGGQDTTTIGSGAAGTRIYGQTAFGYVLGAGTGAGKVYSE